MSKENTLIKLFEIKMVLVFFYACRESIAGQIFTVSMTVVNDNDE